MTAHECEEYIEEPPQRKRYAFRKPERQRDFLRLKLTLPSERRTGKPPPDPLLVLCRLQAHRGSRCSTVTKIPDTTETTNSHRRRDFNHLTGPQQSHKVFITLFKSFLFYFHLKYYSQVTCFYKNSSLKLPLTSSHPFTACTDLKYHF